MQLFLRLRHALAHCRASLMAVGVLCVLSLAACVTVPWTRRAPDPRDAGTVSTGPELPTPRRPGVEAPREPHERAWRKAVAAKEPPTRLVAHDGTSCTVSEARYAEIAVGYVVWCFWVEPESE